MATARTRTETAAERDGGGIAERLNIPYMDGWLMLAALGLIGFSIFTLATATTQDVEGQPLYFVIRQSAYAIVGLILIFAVAGVDYSRFRELRVGIYTAMIAAITFVLVFGAAARGSRRRIELPYFGFQPSEFGKVLLIAALAAFVMERVRRGSDARQTVRLLALGCAPAALVFLQPDLGTALVFGVITLVTLFIAGVKWSHFVAIGAIMVAAATLTLVVAPAAGVPLLRDYQKERLTSFLHPSDDPGNSSYQINQALIAVGSGGKAGRGDKATQTELDFVPERHTDFIFAVIGERYGFLGAAFVLSLYALLIWRALRTMTLSKNFYGTLIAGGIAAMLMFQVFVNVGVNIGIMPVTGITLPLLSYGGSSVLATCIAIGLLQSIHIQAQLSPRGRAQPHLS
ncbi:MAG: rod shape-determining protein RodA [Solirubrobacterales bacterium]